MKGDRIISVELERVWTRLRRDRAWWLGRRHAYFYALAEDMAKLGKIRAVGDIRYEPAEPPLDGFIGLMTACHKTEYWVTAARDLEAMRDERGIIARADLASYLDSLGRTGWRNRKKDGRSRFFGSMTGVAIVDLEHWRELMQTAGEEKTTDMDWVYCNLWRVPYSFKYGKGEYTPDDFQVHPPGSGKDCEAPSPGAWGYLLWAARNEDKFYRMYEASVLDRVREVNRKEQNRKRADLRPQAESKSATRQMPNEAAGTEIPLGGEMVEELNRKLMDR